MEVTLGQLLTALVEIEKLKDEKMNIVAAFKFQKIMRRYQWEREEFARALRKLFEEYAEKDENGQPITTGEGGVKILPDKTESFKEAMNKLLSVTVNISTDDMLTLEELKDIKVTPAFLEVADVFIKKEAIK